MKKCVVLLAFLAAACSSSAPTPDQQRIAALEQEKAQLEAQLKEARSNISKLKAALGRGDASLGDVGTVADGPVSPQPVNPMPDNGVGQQVGGTIGGPANHHN